jgi:serine/threonine-protein kinase
MARPRRADEPDLSEGTRLLDRYTIMDRIGSGGMATIYRAADDRLERIVCVKLLRTTLVGGSGSANTSDRAVYQATYAHFLQEALALSKLQHPNTLRIYDFGYLDNGSGERGAPFHVSEYLDGGNLETHVRSKGAMNVEQTLAILDPISGALAEAHERGIVHRDIKPSNILFARVRGELVAKLADFGIAQSDVKPSTNNDDGSSGPVSTVALFSPRWAAPEQISGAPEGPYTDVYALGLVAVFMLTGRIVFNDDEVRKTFKERIRNDVMVAARLSELALPEALREVLGRSMGTRTPDRIQTPPAFVRALRQALEHVVSVPEPPRSLPLEVGVPEATGVKPLAHRVSYEGARRIRYVAVDERLDLAFGNEGDEPIRVRVTMLPGTPLKLNIKGLTCFVARPNQRPSPALTTSDNGTATLVRSSKRVLGQLRWFFGEPCPEGQIFTVDGQTLLVAYSEGKQIVVLTLDNGNDIIVMCRR